MAKLKNIIKQLSEKDYTTLYNSFIEGNAEKSAYLLKALRKKHLADSRIMMELGVNPNAYYTLRSRVNEKIEGYLLNQVESPRTDILKKVANLNEVIFTQKRTIAITTLKRLEKDLIDYDLPNELTLIYKYLKKLHVSHSDYFGYSQLHNRHVAYMIAVDKVEDMMGEYFKRYGYYLLTNDPAEKTSLTYILKEIKNVATLYKSHRLYVYQSCVLVYHRLFVEEDDPFLRHDESIEDIFVQVKKTFKKYKLDPIYYHLNVIFEFLALEYYMHYKVYGQAERYVEEVEEAIPTLLMNYANYTFPPRALISKLEHYLRMGRENKLHGENSTLFIDYEIDTSNIPTYVIYMVYMAMSCYYAQKYSDAAKLLSKLLNEVSLKRYVIIQTEIRMLLALQYCMMNEFDLFTTLSNTIQRQFRLLEKAMSQHLAMFNRVLRIAFSEKKQKKYEKITPLIAKIEEAEVTHFSPTKLIRMDEEFIRKLVAINYVPRY